MKSASKIKRRLSEISTTATYGGHEHHDRSTKIDRQTSTTEPIDAVDEKETQTELPQPPSSLSLESSSISVGSNKTEQESRATQTLDANRRMSAVDEPVSPRHELLSLIDASLNETIDHVSRSRASQLIIANIRKHAQIWIDVKEFVASALLPDSIMLAMKIAHK